MNVQKIQDGEWGNSGARKYAVDPRGWKLCAKSETNGLSHVSSAEEPIVLRQMIVFGLAMTE